MITAGVVAGVVLSEGCTPEGRAASPGLSSAGSARVAGRNPQMGYRRLGRTGLMISEIVLDGRFRDPQGGSSWDRFTTGELPPEVVKNRTEVVSKCIDEGINYVDITRGNEALAYGAALRGRRDQMYIAADDAEYAMRQNRNRNRESQTKNIESCLRKLGTDHLDVWRPQFKPMGGHRDVDLELCIDVFEKARSQGKVRFLGMSTYDRTWILHVIERFPQYMIVYAPYTPGFADPASVDQKLLETARAKEVGIILVQPSGPEAALGTIETQTERLPAAEILTDADVTAVVVEMDALSDVDAAVKAVAERRASTSPA
jgi:predicted aldo/keto reductase-like oxidoreductase